MSDLAAYLAKNYLTADPSPAASHPKKKRRKNAAVDTTPSGLIIADDDPPSLSNTGGGGLDDDDEDGPSIVGASGARGRSGEFRRKKVSGWKTLSGDNTGEGEKAAADAILAGVIAERRQRGGDDQDGDEDAPVVEEDPDAVRMESGALAGLQTAAQTAAMVAAQEKRKKKEAAAYKDSALGEKAQETIYRDASGRIINVALKRAEARRAEEEKKVAEEEAKQALMGDVQRQEREERRQQMQEIKAMPLARTAEDEEMNDALKAQQRWNDPAAQFLSNSGEKARSRSGKPLYQGGFAPNRYGIRPGHRWDGVDRGNGFEKDWFMARNRKGRLEALDYAWQMDE
ncbi:hypothetical protein BO71DRAFT_403613 [Aspergillus ellipticus CBS 707.79]|uniref:Cell cycle control protein n=1 Tax=Aspergillus ellipticus CBS 707.79 TaxID=1448320 RepID=A0A319CW93_9EURO|nr:hypothetical protein BO71DRAFT_404654 [Aspergillus ellipticus CBS 707.79]PYH88751.1 hypothetical protein BO71DRAFT_403613 [Aspergillus ellipticus CBS 707.79]